MVGWTFLLHYVHIGTLRLRKLCIFILSAPEPSTRASSIAVVTQSQFALVEAAVRDLEAKGAPPPPPKMPDNKKLKEDIVRGSASLTDTMRAMNVSSLTMLFYFILLIVYYHCSIKTKMQCCIATILPCLYTCIIL